MKKKQRRFRFMYTCQTCKKRVGKRASKAAYYSKINKDYRCSLCKWREITVVLCDGRPAVIRLCRDSSKAIDNPNQEEPERHYLLLQKKAARNHALSGCSYSHITVLIDGIICWARAYRFQFITKFYPYKNQAKNLHRFSGKLLDAASSRNSL